MVFVVSYLVGIPPVSPHRHRRKQSARTPFEKEQTIDLEAAIVVDGQILWR